MRIGESRFPSIRSADATKIGVNGGVVIHNSTNQKSKSVPYPRQTIGRRRAKYLYDSGWWRGLNARQIVRFQLFTRELVMPFGLFHEAMEEALKRPVYLHEFGLNLDGLILEFMGESDEPTWNDLERIIPDNKPMLKIRLES
jgi:hypothetical protein